MLRPGGLPAMPLNLSRHKKWRTTLFRLPKSRTVTVLAFGLRPWGFVVGLIAFFVVCLYVPEITNEDYFSGSWH